MEMTEKKYKQHLTVWIIVTIILVGGAYYAGIKHEAGKAHSSSYSRGAGGYAGAGGGMTGRFASGTGLITGTVISKDATSITVQDKTGSTKIVLYSGSTQVLESTQGTIDNVAVGSQISAQGTQNTDGSVTASSIQIRPNMPPSATGSTAAPAPAGNPVQ